MPIILEPEQTIYQAAQLLEQCREVLSCHSMLQLNLSRVTEIDCAALQVLIWARQEALRQNKSCQLIDPSPAVTCLLTLLGISDLVDETHHGS